MDDIPASLFDRAFYLDRYADVAAAGIDPLQHFLAFGLHENRTPHPLFDPHFYAAQLPPSPHTPPLLHYLRHGTPDPHPLFDTAHYLAQFAPGDLDGQPPLLHFLTVGHLADLSPNPLFDAAYYRRSNPQAGPLIEHPLLHYVVHGWRQGCRPHPLFDPAYYLRMRPDVAAAGIDPLAHYLQHGHAEFARTHALFDDARYRRSFADEPEQLKAIDRLGPIIHFAQAARPVAPPSRQLLHDCAPQRRHRDKAISLGGDGDAHSKLL
ncbi:hypothetical protein [Lichenicoccus sp.]|uniref:hypothetical protein n=1 Tax=Lichenicoccus sp. TaxID=2781899 RepID=UPI003D0BCB92